MPLPILQTHHRPGREDLIRYFHRTELHWCRQLAEDETQLDVGVALTNPKLPLVHDANAMLDASLPEGFAPAEAIELADAHFRAAGTRCGKWILNASAPPERNRPLAEQLIARGYEEQVQDIMYLAGRPAGAIEEVGGLTLIPARASFRHARQLAEESARDWETPQLADAWMLHLEDPQCDSVLALKEGVAAALVIVLTVGEIGGIQDVFVSEPFRGRGVGRTVMSRALEICARSLFKHVFLSVDPTNTPAINLYRKVGFERIAPLTIYRVRD